MGWGPGLGFLGAHRQDLGQVSGLGLRLQVRDGGPSPLHCREQESQTSDPLCPTSWSEGGRSGSREQHHESQQGSECIPAQDAGGEQGHSALREVRNSGGWVSCPRSPGGSQVFYLPCPGAPLGGVTPSFIPPPPPQVLSLQLQSLEELPPSPLPLRFRILTCRLGSSLRALLGLPQSSPRRREHLPRLVARDWSGHSRREPDAWAWSSPGPSSPSWAWSSCTSVSGETTTSTLVTPGARAVSPEARSAPTPGGPGHTRPSNQDRGSLSC